MKRRTIMLLIAVLIIAISVGVYFALRKAPQAPETPQTSWWDSLISGITGEQPGTTPGPEGPGSGMESDESENVDSPQHRISLVQLTDGAVADYWIASSSKLFVPTSTDFSSGVFYITDTGAIMHAKDVSAKESYAQLPSVPVKSVQSPDGSKLIFWLQSGDVIYFDAYRKTAETIENAASAAFSPDSSRLALLVPDGNTEALVVRDFSKNTRTRLVSAGLADMTLQWPEENRIYLLPRLSAYLASDIWYFDLKNKSLVRYDSGQGLGAVFSQNGRALLFLNTGLKTVSVSYRSQAGDQHLAFTTFPQKCAGGPDFGSVYCAVPADMSRTGSVMPDEYLQEKVVTKDVMYAIDAGGDLRPLYDLRSSSIDAMRLRYMEKQLFFMNRYDRKLYMLDMRNYE